MYYGSQGSCGCGGNQGYYPNYGYSYPYVMYPGYGYQGNSNYAIIIVLFILLVIIIGSHWGR